MFTSGDRSAPGALTARSVAAPFPNCPVASAKPNASPRATETPNAARVQSCDGIAIDPVVARPAGLPWTTCTVPADGAPIARSACENPFRSPAASERPSSAFACGDPLTPATPACQSWSASVVIPYGLPYRTWAAPCRVRASDSPGAPTARSSCADRPKSPAASAQPKLSPASAASSAPAVSWCTKRSGTPVASSPLPGWP